MNKSQPPPYSYTPAEVYQPGQAPPPQLYPQMPQPQPPPHQQSTVIIQTTTNSTVALGNTPTRALCPSCRAEILTSVKHTSNCKTHTFALILCLFICWPCVCIPYCMDSCQSANHYCPNCNAYIGTFDN